MAYDSTIDYAPDISDPLNLDVDDFSPDGSTCFDFLEDCGERYLVLMCCNLHKEDWENVDGIVKKFIIRNAIITIFCTGKSVPRFFWRLSKEHKHVHIIQEKTIYKFLKCGRYYI